MIVRFKYGNPCPVKGKIVSVRRSGHGPFETVVFTVQKGNNRRSSFMLHRVNAEDRPYMVDAVAAAEEYLKTLNKEDK